jgi:hypothetical protein
MAVAVEEEAEPEPVESVSHDGADVVASLSDVGASTGIPSKSNEAAITVDQPLISDSAGVRVAVAGEGTSPEPNAELTQQRPRPSTPRGRRAGQLIVGVAVLATILDLLNNIVDCISIAKLSADGNSGGAGPIFL